MIDGVNKKFEELNIKNVDFLSVTIFNNKLTKGSYDAIVLFGVLHLLKDNDKVMKRINDLLKPGGYFISTTACLKEKMSIRNKIEFFLYMFVKKIDKEFIADIHLS